MSSAKKTLRAPILAKELELVPLSSLNGVELTQSRILDCAQSGARGRHVNLDGVLVVGGSLSETTISQLSWLDVVCERCDLSMCEWPAAKLTRVEFRDCRLTGARFSQAELSHVRFVGCQLDYAAFSRAQFRQALFENCRLTEAYFSEATLAGTAFVGCQLDGVDFTRAKLQGADVSESTMTDMRIGAEDVRGMVVNGAQAVALAQLFGLVVR